jgi:hypothetical protein
MDLKVDFKMIAHPKDANHIIAIDVIQHIDGKPVTETVQRTAGEAYEPLGIAGLSIERLVEVYKKMMHQLRSQSKLLNIDVTVTMSPTSPISGHLSAYLETPDAPAQSSILVDYQHYYVLKALRDKMIEQMGESWSQVRAVYHSGDVEFCFDYS